VEQWLNDTLQDAEYMKIPGTILKVDHKNPISRYGIERMLMTNAGIPNDDVSRLYRGFFVHTVGFFRFIKELVDYCDDRHLAKAQLITSIWRVF